MAFSVFFANVNKAENSTFQFNTGGTGVKLASCELKAATSVLKPVLKLYDEYANFSAWTVYTVAYIGVFGQRYYKIINWVWNGTFIECYLEVDVMATYKTQLSTQSFYVTRTSNASYWNKQAVDTQYPALSGYTSKYSSYVKNPLAPADTDYGVFIVGVLNNNPSFGSVEYIAMSFLNFMDFCTQMLTLSNMGDDTGVPELIAKAAANPYQYIVSCIWLPFTVTDLYNWGYIDNTGTNVVELGYYSLTMNTYVHPLDDTILYIHRTSYQTLSVPQHPNKAARGNFVQNAPYSRYILDFYPFGSFELDAGILSNISTLALWYSVDIRTGAGILKLSDQIVEDPITHEYTCPICFKTVEAQIGVDVPYSTIQSKMPTTIGGIISTAITGVSQFGGFDQLFKSISSSFVQGAAAATNNFGLGQGKLGEMATNAVMENIGAEPLTAQDMSKIATGMVAANSFAEINGMQGTLSFFHTCPLSLTAYFATLADMDADSFGYPCMQRLQMSNCSKFTVCHKARPQLYNATQPELQEVTNILNSGFVWE